MGHLNGDVQEAVGRGLDAQGRSSAGDTYLGISRPQMGTHAEMAGEILKLPRMTNKCTREGGNSGNRHI